MNWVSLLGEKIVILIAGFGYHCALLIEGLFWLFGGQFIKQPVHLTPILDEMVNIGLNALPIVSLLSITIGIMLAVQGIKTLETFGAQEQVVLGVALSVTREFGPLIVAILVAGRSGSAFAARIGTMIISQEIDALKVMGISPVRYLVAPALIAMLICVPALTFLADILGLLGGAILTHSELGISYPSFFERAMNILTVEDIMQGIIKSGIFALLIVLISATNGFSVKGGADEVGKATTHAVVKTIAAILVADGLFTYLMN